MKFAYMIPFATAVLLCSCGNRVKTAEAEGCETVVYDQTAGGDLFHCDLIREIELIPLETSDSSLIGTSPELISDGTDYYVIDRNGSQKILRYDTTGTFLNTIGNRGKGPQEYLEVSNVVVRPESGELLVFSGMDSKVCTYQKEGKFVSGRKIEHAFNQGMPAEDGNLWLYLGYKNGTSDYRVLKIDGYDKILGSMLSATEEVMPMDESFPVFIPTHDGQILLRESLNHRVSSITDTGVVPVYQFDFGECNVPKEYYEQSSPMEAAELLMKKKFAILDRVMDNKNYTIVQGLIQKPDDAPTLIYGIKHKAERQWRWFNVEDPANNKVPGLNAIRYLTNNDELICQSDPARLMEMTPEERAVFRNPEIIDRLSEESNPVILKCRLK